MTSDSISDILVSSAWLEVCSADMDAAVLEMVMARAVWAAADSEASDSSQSLPEAEDEDIEEADSDRSSPDS